VGRLSRGSFDTSWIPELEKKLASHRRLIDEVVEDNVRARIQLRTRQTARDLMEASWKPLRMMDWCLDEEEKAETREHGFL